MVLGAIALISTAIGGTIGLVTGLSQSHAREKQSIANGHTEAMQSLSYEHYQVMERLKNEATSEDHRHEEVMLLLNILDRALKTVGAMITEAKCDGCIGLPGNLIIFLKWFQ